MMIETATEIRDYVIGSEQFSARYCFVLRREPSEVIVAGFVRAEESST